MCGRYSLTGPNPAQLSGRFGYDEPVAIRARYNIAPTDEVLTVTTTREGEPRGDLLRWGLVPYWAKDASGAARMINARAETAADKPAFRDAFARRRCLVVADGFYEWQRSDTGKQAFWITRADGQPFAFAGLWATWRGGADAGSPLRTCSILTTRANAALADVHDRMPVMLPGAEEEHLWLDPATLPTVLHDLLAPAPDDGVARRPVGPAVNSVRNDGPECLEAPTPAAAAETAGTLF